MGTKVRILVDVKLDGQSYAPNSVVDLPSAVAKSLVESGQADANKEAVAYCIKELGAEVTVHVDSAVAEAAAAAKAAAIAELQAKIDAAAPADKAALEAELASLTAE